MIGICSHIFVLIDPKQKQDEAAGVGVGAGAAPPARLFSYQEAIREVVIRRPETEFEHQARLMSMIMTRWRAPQHKRLFEEQLIYLLQAVGEYNAETKRAPALHTKAVPNL